MVERTDEQHAEKCPGGNRRSAVPCVELATEVLDPFIEAGIGQKPIEPFKKDVSRCGGQILRGHPHFLLPLAASPSQRHAQFRFVGRVRHSSIASRLTITTRPPPEESRVGGKGRFSTGC